MKYIFIIIIALITYVIGTFVLKEKLSKIKLSSAKKNIITFAYSFLLVILSHFSNKLNVSQMIHNIISGLLIGLFVTLSSSLKKS